MIYPLGLNRNNVRIEREDFGFSGGFFVFDPLSAFRYSDNGGHGSKGG